METKQQTQAKTLENLRLETGWKNTLLIKETECILDETFQKIRLFLEFFPTVLRSHETSQHVTEHFFGFVFRKGHRVQFHRSGSIKKHCEKSRSFNEIFLEKINVIYKSHLFYK